MAVSPRDIESVLAEFPIELAQPLGARLGNCFGRVPVGYSYLAPIEEGPDYSALVPSYQEAVPQIREALHECQSFNLPFGFLDCMNGLVPCMLPEYGHLFGCVLAPSLSRLETCSELFIKPGFCESCIWAGGCSGVRKGYVRLHGIKGLRPVTKR